MNYQVVKLFKNKPAELFSNGHSLEEAKSICEKWIEEMLSQKKVFSEDDYLLAYQYECNNCKNNML